MFSNCTYLTSIGDISSWSTSNMTDIQQMFYNCYSLELPGDLSGWCAENILTKYLFANNTPWEMDTEKHPNIGEPC